MYRYVCTAYARARMGACVCCNVRRLVRVSHDVSCQYDAGLGYVMFTMGMSGCAVSAYG